MYLRNKVTGAVTDDLDSQSLEYQILKRMTIAQGQTEQGGGQPVPSSGTVSLWEDVAQEDVGEDPAGGRVLVIALGPAATAGTENTAESNVPEVAGTVTDIEWVPQSPYAGAATNNRQIAVHQITTAGTGTVTRTDNVLGQKAMDQTVNLNAYQPQNIPITVSALAAGAPVTVVSAPNGTGLPDPGGVVYLTYTRT